MTNKEVLDKIRAEIHETAEMHEDGSYYIRDEQIDEYFDAYIAEIKPQDPKTGHWIQTNEFFINQDGKFIYKNICSECKSLSYFREKNKKAIGTNVCPNCGAKMVEPQERCY